MEVSKIKSFNGKIKVLSENLRRPKNSIIDLSKIKRDESRYWRNRLVEAYHGSRNSAPDNSVEVVKVEKNIPITKKKKGDEE